MKNKPNLSDIKNSVETYIDDATKTVPENCKDIEISNKNKEKYNKSFKKNNTPDNNSTKVKE